MPQDASRRRLTWTAPRYRPCIVLPGLSCGEKPLEAGLPPGFEVVEEIEAGIDFEDEWADLAGPGYGIHRTSAPL